MYFNMYFRWSDFITNLARSQQARKLQSSQGKTRQPDENFVNETYNGEITQPKEMENAIVDEVREPELELVTEKSERIFRIKAQDCEWVRK